MSEQGIEWCAVPVRIDDATEGLFEMPSPDEDPEQKPVFQVTQTTANLVAQDFELYRPSLVRMLATWVEEKNRALQQAARGESQSAGQGFRKAAVK